MPDVLATSKIDLDAYFKRIGYQGANEVSLGALKAVHEAHIASVPFENLDIFLGKPIEIGFETVFDKIVKRNRGGYCFETNGLLAAALEAMGFEITRLQGRVWFQRATLQEPFKKTPPLRSHMLILITLPDGGNYLADTGFGATGIFSPLVLKTDMEQPQRYDTYRLLNDPEFGYMLQYKHSKHGWSDMYSFDLSPQHPNDYIHANFYTCRSPESWFTHLPICTKPVADGRLILQNKTLKLNQHHTPLWERELTSAEEYRQVLQEEFNVPLAAEEGSTLFDAMANAKPLY